MIDLGIKPFNLDDRQQDIVKEILAGMTVEEKIGQLFCPCLSAFDENAINYYVKDLKVGALMIRPFAREGLCENIAKVQNMGKIPLLMAANLENGGCGAVAEGTMFANPMGCAATGDEENGYRLGKVSCAEAAEVGINWGFAPVVDIDKNYHNPIANIRTFGDDAHTVLSFAREYIRAAKEEGVMPTIKHFPGDGMDERDQHLLVSVNDCSFDAWMESYGMVYAQLIEEGVPAIMAGHIAAPYVAREVRPQISDREALFPASQSEALLNGILREKLGFNGLIVTDSTLMVGYMQNMPRKLAIPRSIACGADMILFNRSLEEDIGYIHSGLEAGILSEARLDEAVLRILGTKMSCGLFDKKHPAAKTSSLSPEITKTWVRNVADRAVTLVKDDRDLLPISPEKTKRIFLNVIENKEDNRSPFAREIKKRLQREGFEVTLYRRKYSFDAASLTLEKITPTVKKRLDEILCNTEQFVGKYDLALIVLNLKTASNATVVRINWSVLFGMGNDLPWYSGEMPLVAVSFCNPYHLLDIPMAHAYINAYSDNEATLDAAFDKLMGRSAFYGKSPVDPFCGKLDTRL